MAAPIKAVIPPNVGDKRPPEPRHPGFYTGSDPKEWARNKAAQLRYITAGLRAIASGQGLLDANEREITMLEALSK